MTATREAGGYGPVEPVLDSDLLRQFEERIGSGVPHLLPDGRVGNPTTLVDVTEMLLRMAKEEYGLDLRPKGVKVYGKFEGENLGGSVKTRPAAQIIREAISTGALSRDKVVFEATSGNFGVSLGLLSGMGLKIIALISRRLRKGVLRALEDSDVKTIDLDVDICPAPGMTIDPDAAAARGVAQSVRQKLSEYGFGLAPFDRARSEAERLLARQDVIGLAKLLARIYDGFCPEQYENELNPVAHSSITGPEIDSQLRELGTSLAEVDVVCTFGTGGTSTGLSRYISAAHGRKGVRVVFPLAGQDVAGIRTKEKASGLRFYRPDLYLSEHEADFESARRLLPRHLKKTGDIGESSALALYAALQLVNYGAGGRFVVILADGVEKYLDGVGQQPSVKSEVSLQEARSDPQAYDAIIWTHSTFTPKDEGIKVLADALGCEPSKIRVANTTDVRLLVTTGDAPPGIQEMLPTAGRRVLLVCMVGGTSLTAAKYLGEKGVGAQSLTGGIMAVAASVGKALPQLLKQGN